MCMVGVVGASAWAPAGGASASTRWCWCLRPGPPALLSHAPGWMRGLASRPPCPGPSQTWSREPMTGLSGRRPCFAGSHGRGTKLGVLGLPAGDSGRSQLTLGSSTGSPYLELPPFLGCPFLKALSPSVLPCTPRLSSSPCSLGWLTLRTEGREHGY